MSDLTDVCADIDRNINIGTAVEVDLPENCGDILGNPENTLRIVTQNIRSVNKNFDGLIVLLERMNIGQDIIVLTECWLSKTVNIPKIPDYNTFYTTRSNNQNDGVIIYVKDTYKNVKVTEPDYAEELNCLIITINDITVIGVYRPCEFKNTEKFSMSLDKILKEFNNTNIIFIGDINIDIKVGNESSKSNDYLEILAMHGLSQSHNFLTNNKSCLDHCFIKSSFPVITIICKSTLTDHFSLITELSKCSFSKTCFTPNISTKIDYSALNSYLESIEWEVMLNQKPPNEATDLFIETIKEAINIYSIMKSTSRRKASLKPWITPGLIRCMRHRDRLHKKLRLDKENVILKISYTRYRQTCNKVLKNLKHAYFRKKFTLNKNNLKERWKIIKDICHMKKATDEINTILNIKGNTNASLNYINNYFANIGKQLSSNILTKNKTTETAILRNLTNESKHANSFVLMPVDSDEVRCVINSLKSSSSCGWDGITSRTLKMLQLTLSYPIALICNCCFDQGVFPNSLKKSIVIPIFKSGEKSEASNYRPISLLPSLAKVIEKLLNSRLKSYLEKYGILSFNQYGFRNKRSTTDAINKLLTFVTENLDRGDRCTGIFLDLKKAFDTVSYQLLFKKLENIGIRGTPLKLFKDYMTDRKQYVRVAEFKSEEVNIEYGVPQGSVLGPTLFLIYLNDLCNLSIKNGEIIAFADDTVLLFHGKTWEQTNKYANDGFQIVTKWLENNLLTLSVPKTKYINFSIRANSQPEPNKVIIQAHNIYCNRNDSSCICDKIIQAKSLRYLGVIIDSHLIWKEHVNMLTARVRKLVYIFKLLRHVCDPKLVLDTYFALCNSIILYAIEAWGGTYKNLIISIERAQRCVLKVMTFKHFRYSTYTLYQENPVLSVRQMYIKQIIIKQHSQLAQDNHLSKRRTDKIYKVPFRKTTFSQRFSSYLGPLVYNRISEVVNLKHLKLHSLKKYIYKYLKSLTYDKTEDLLKSLIV